MLLAASTPALHADGARDEHRRVEALRSLSINRSLLTGAEAEYEALQKEDAQDPTDRSAKRLEDLRYKIQALQDDAARLQAPLPRDVKADEYLKELLVRQEKLGDAKKKVDPQAERAFDQKVRSVYRLHEKALAAIAEKRFRDAEGLYEEIVMTSPDDEEAYMLLGHTCILSGNYEKAARAFHNAISIRPENMREIPRLYENILVENPSDDETMAQLGYVYLLLGNESGARRSFEEALKLNPANMEARRGILEIP